MENEKSRENVINAGFVTAGELPERHGIHGGRVAKDNEETWGVNYRLVDYLTAAAQSSKHYRDRDGVDYARFYHGGSVSVLYADSDAEPACALGEIDNTDVVRQVYVENGLKQR